MKCEFENDYSGIYLTPLIGFSIINGKNSFWIGWLWWLWTFTFDGWISKLLGKLLSVNLRLQKLFVKNAK